VMVKTSPASTTYLKYVIAFGIAILTLRTL
jgi:hypothetical protein